MEIYNYVSWTDPELLITEPNAVIKHGSYVAASLNQRGEKSDSRVRISLWNVLFNLLLMFFANR